MTVAKILSLFFFLGAMPTAWEISWARDRTRTTAVTQATTGAVQDPQPVEPTRNSKLIVS